MVPRPVVVRVNGANQTSSTAFEVITKLARSARELMVPVAPLPTVTAPAWVAGPLAQSGLDTT